MEGGVIYMPEVHGVGLNQPNILDTYKKQIQEAEIESQRATEVAQKMVAEKIQRESKAKQDIYGETLGNMYDGDRTAIEEFRNHIKKEFEAGVYSTDPSLYATRIKNLNAMIDNAESFYKTTYGDDSADGTGNTYRDIQIRNERGNSVEFWEDQGLELKGDEWAEAQKRYQELQRGMYRDLQFTPDGNVMARALNPDTGEMGELVSFENLPQREIGTQNYMPDTRVLSPESLMDLAGDGKVQQRLYQFQNGLLTEAGKVTYEGSLIDVKDMDELQKMNYMSDMYFDDNVTKGLNNSEARKFRRSLAKEVVPPLSDEELDVFVSGDLGALKQLMGHEEGSTESRYTAMMNEARRHWREVTRRAFIKDPKPRATGTGKQPESELDLNRMVFDAGFDAMQPGSSARQVFGDTFQKPIEIKASTMLIEAGFDTEKDNYEIIGAAFDDKTGEFIARIQVPVMKERFNESTEETETYTDYETKDIRFSRGASGLSKELYGAIMGPEGEMRSEIGQRLEAKRAIYLQGIIDEQNL
jgi:hypothetical protein